MDFSKLKIEHIKINADYSIKYMNASKELKSLIIKTPLLYLPFGIDKQYNNYIMSLQLKKTDDFENNKKIDNFLLFIKDLETHFEKETGLHIKSQLRQNAKYPPILTTKVIKYNTKIITKVLRENTKENINIFSLDRDSSLKAELIIDKLWEYNDELTYKIKLQTIYI